MFVGHSEMLIGINSNVYSFCSTSLISFYDSYIIIQKSNSVSFFFSSNFFPSKPKICPNNIRRSIRCRPQIT